jgi:hypothetical protein
MMQVDCLILSTWNCCCSLTAFALPSVVVILGLTAVTVEWSPIEVHVGDNITLVADMRPGSRVDRMAHMSYTAVEP